jgi:hypothetical protein
MSDAETIAAGSIAPPDGLRDYLALRDVPCPGCGYNLRGVQESVCPECGGEIALSVTKAAGGRGWLWLLVLALGWTLLASGMHTTRSALIARDEARVVSGFQVLLSSSFNVTAQGGSAPTMVLGNTLRSTTSTTTTTVPSTSSRTPITISRPLTGQSVTRAGPVTVLGAPGAVTIRNGTPTTAGSGLVWSQVRAQTWATLGVSLALALCAAVVLLIVILRRRKIAQAGPSRLLMAAALGVFAVYAAGQVFLFARELAG